MDPLSITVSSITILGTIAATRKAAKKLLALRIAPVEILQLSNEIADFEAMAAKNEELIDSLRSQDGDEAIIHSLERSNTDAMKILESLRELLQDQILENCGNANSVRADKVEFSKIAWLKRQGKAKKLQNDLRDERAKMSRTQTLISSSAIPEFRTELHAISIQGRENNAILRSMLQTTSEILATAQQAPPSAPPIIQEPSTEGQQAVVSIRTQQPALLTIPQAEDTNSSVGVSTLTYAAKKCKVRFCQCRCHKMSKVQPLSWASQLVGSLFVGYSGISLPFMHKVECTEKVCQRTEERLVKVTYYFPSWMPYVSRAISFMDSWNGLDGHQVFVNFPRIIPAAAELFVLAQKGNIEGVKGLIEDRKASIYDVSDSEGRSALHFALTANQPEMAAFLISLKASVIVEDKQSLSPIDVLWNYLLDTPNDPINVAFKEAFKGKIDESEDLQKRNFSALHLAVFGLSTIPLEDHLQLSTAEIDVQCSFGRTPLCWAAQFRHDHNNVLALVRYGAALHLHDKRLQTPLHFAAETGSFESLKIILKIAALLDSPEDCRMVIRDLAAAEDFLSADDEGNSHAGFACKELIEAKDYKGRSALHFAVRTNQVRHAELLIKYGADVDSPDSVLGRTPLFIAIYWNHHCMIRLLLRSQARLDMADDGAMTVLHYTAKFGDSETIRILSLENFQGISPNCRDRQGQTPRDIFENVRPSVMAEGEAVAAVSRKYFEQILNGLVVINR